MGFTVEVHPRVVKAMKSLPPAHYERIHTLLKVLREEPVPAGIYDVKKLKGTGDLALYRVRAGEYRLIYAVDWKRDLVRVLRLESRGRAYK